MACRLVIAALVLALATMIVAPPPPNDPTTPPTPKVGGQDDSNVYQFYSGDANWYDKVDEYYPFVPTFDDNVYIATTGISVEDNKTSDAWFWDPSLFGPAFNFEYQPVLDDSDSDGLVGNCDPCDLDPTFNDWDSDGIIAGCDMCDFDPSGVDNDNDGLLAGCDVNDFDNLNLSPRVDMDSDGILFECDECDLEPQGFVDPTHKNVLSACARFDPDDEDFAFGESSASGFGLNPKTFNDNSDGIIDGVDSGSGQQAEKWGISYPKYWLELKDQDKEIEISGLGDGENSGFGKSWDDIVDNDPCLRYTVNVWLGFDVNVLSDALLWSGSGSGSAGWLQNVDELSDFGESSAAIPPESGSGIVRSGSGAFEEFEIILPKVDRGSAFDDVPSVLSGSGSGSGMAADGCYLDMDSDGVIYECDPCDFDPTNSVDDDSDGILGPCDLCDHNPYDSDDNSDGFIDGCAPAGALDDFEEPALVDTDLDIVIEECDFCDLDGIDEDQDSDGIPAGCDPCDNDHDNNDHDSDGIIDGCVCTPVVPYWSTWSECSRSCGGDGQSVRTRCPVVKDAPGPYCVATHEEEICAEESCLCSWDMEENPADIVVIVDATAPHYQTLLAGAHALIDSVYISHGGRQIGVAVATTTDAQILVNFGDRDLRVDYLEAIALASQYQAPPNAQSNFAHAIHQVVNVCGQKLASKPVFALFVESASMFTSDAHYASVAFEFLKTVGSPFVVAYDEWDLSSLPVGDQAELFQAFTVRAASEFLCWFCPA